MSHFLLHFSFFVRFHGFSLRLILPSYYNGWENDLPEFIEFAFNTHCSDRSTDSAFFWSRCFAIHARLLDAALARALTCAHNDGLRYSSFPTELPTKQTS